MVPLLPADRFFRAFRPFYHRQIVNKKDIFSIAAARRWGECGAGRAGCMFDNYKVSNFYKITTEKVGPAVIRTLSRHTQCGGWCNSAVQYIIVARYWTGRVWSDGSTEFLPDQQGSQSSLGNYEYSVSSIYGSLCSVHKAAHLTHLKIHWLKNIFYSFLVMKVLVINMRNGHQTGNCPKIQIKHRCFLCGASVPGGAVRCAARYNQWYTTDQQGVNVKRRAGATLYNVHP